MEYAMAEKIIRFYNKIDSEINMQMKFLADIENNYYCVGIRGQTIDGMPHGKNKISNITELTALGIPEDINKEYQKIQENISDLCACRSAITKSINTLNTVEKKHYH